MICRDHRVQRHQNPTDTMLTYATDQIMRRETESPLRLERMNDRGDTPLDVLFPKLPSSLLAFPKTARLA